ncbi:hypothetical protein HK102_003326 [Quaeritorhiza haematococci]|nr:hypothetical protein HK102_003326 [Quaeritorhiza haematococci]
MNNLDPYMVRDMEVRLRHYIDTVNNADEIPLGAPMKSRVWAKVQEENERVKAASEGVKPSEGKKGKCKPKKSAGAYGNAAPSA